MASRRSGKKKETRAGAGKTVPGGIRAKHPPGKDPAHRPAAPPEKAGPLVLIVDDYEDAREMCSELMRFHGFRIEQACNGYEAVDKAFSLLPDIILMDLSLPGMDGWEATRRIKADERTRRIPVLAVTGHALEGHEERARQAGCDSFITKPVMPEDLLKEVRQLLALSEKQKLKVN